MQTIKLTPILFVEAIEPSLRFWVDGFGFEKTIEVPDGAALGFVALARDGVEVMLQTHASAAKDVTGLTTRANGTPMTLYIEVDELDPVLEASEGFEVVVPERTTFYGMREIGLREPGGHVVTFATRGEA